MSKLGAVDYQWDENAGVMRPLKRYLTLLQEACIHGAVYKLEPSRRSQLSHNHQFRELDRAWDNVPDETREALNLYSAEDLRKWALCQTKYCTVDRVACPSLEYAETLMRYVRRCRGSDYILCSIEPIDESDPLGPCKLISKLPHSQSKRAMGGTVFQESKDAVLDVVAHLLGTTAEALKRATLEAA